MHCIGVIPARYQSSRFPGKPLADINGSPMIQWVYDRAMQTQSLDEVIVATDNPQIRDAVQAFGGRVTMTSAAHRSGTDRVAEVAESLDAELIVNIQGDEPLIDPAAIDAAVRPLAHYPDREMATLACPIADEEAVNNPNMVKVVFASDGRALYFSRAPIPFHRRRPGDSGSGEDGFWQHIGLYVYRRDFLLKFAAYEPTRLEKTESLEQLRALEHGHNIHVEQTDYRSVAVDTPEDLEHVHHQLAETEEK